MEYLFTKTPLAFFVQNLWRDEAFTFVLSEQSVGNILKSTAADFNPPLYYLVMHYWMMIFGSSEVAMRSLSLVFYVLTIFIMFEILVLVFKIPFKRALVYFSLIIVNPVLLTYAFEARMYMMAAFFVTLSYFALMTGRKKLYIVAITLALYTHYFTVLILLAQILVHMLSSHSSISWIPDLRSLHSLVRNDNKNSVYQFIIHNSIFIIPFALFVPWLLFLFSFHSFGSLEFWVIKQPIGDIIYLPFVLFTGYQRVFGEYYHGAAGYTNFHTIITIIVSAIVLLPILLHNQIKRLTSNVQLLTNLFLWAFLPPTFLYIISLFATPIYHPRYFMFSAVGFLLYLILVIDSFLQIYEKRLLQSVYSHFKPPHFLKKNTAVSFVKRNTLLILTVILLLFVTGKYNTLNLKYNAKRTVVPMLREIDLAMNPNDKVYLTRELDYFLAKYYMKNDSIYIFDIPYENLPSYIGTVLIPPTRIATGIPLYPARSYFVYYDRYVVRSEM